MAKLETVEFEAKDFFAEIAETFTWTPQELAAVGIEALVEPFYNGRYLFLRYINTQQPVKGCEMRIVNENGDRVLDAEESYWGLARFIGFDMDKVNMAYDRVKQVVITYRPTGPFTA